MTIPPLPQGTSVFLGPNGQVLSGGTVATWIPRTSALKTTWLGPTEATPNANPIVLNSAGAAVIYGQGAYRTVVKDASGDVISDSVTFGGQFNQTLIVLNIGDGGLFTVPPGVYSLYIEAVGGGGAGSNCVAGSAIGDVSGGGGGAGGFANGQYAVTPGESFSYYVGRGGARSSQDQGEETNFGKIIGCQGGKGAAFFSQGTSAGGAGGTASGGTIINLTGGAGTDGSHIPPSGGAPYIGFGNGGGSFYGPGGASTNGGDGEDGPAPGSGGGGTMDVNLTSITFNGGAGADGQILIVYWS